MSKVQVNLRQHSIELPTVAAPVGSYVPFIVVDRIVYISGQLPAWKGELRYVGKVGQDLGVDQGYQAARTCALNILAQLSEACSGDLDRVRRVIKLGGFVNCTPDFIDAPKCINGASDLMIEVFGVAAGAHARFAVGAASLPSGAAVEVEAIFEIS